VLLRDLALIMLVAAVTRVGCVTVGMAGRAGPAGTTAVYQEVVVISFVEGDRSDGLREHGVILISRIHMCGW
jgi:hypothetical protein